MASGLWSEGQIWCPTCLNTLTDPVTLPCGHSYCMGCIRTQWDRVDHIGVYSCPQCGETFSQRPDVHRNTELADVVEQLRSSSFHDPPPAPSPAGPGDVPCDVCTGRPARAVKSCLVCLASYCQTHLQPHRQSPALSAHLLVDAAGRPGGSARADPQGLWDPLWQMGGDNRSSSVVNLEQQRATRAGVQDRLRSKQQELRNVMRTAEAVRSSAHLAVQNTDRIFTELIRSIERTRSELTQLIRAQERAAVSQAEGLLERLEQEIAELRRRDAELSQLSHTEDHIHFLQKFQSVCVPPGAGDSPSIPVSPHFSPEAVRRAVSGLKERLENFCKEELVKISRTVTDVSSQEPAEPGTTAEAVSEVYSLQTPEPRTRAELLHYACQLTLDPNTAHRQLCLSEGNRKVTWSREPQQYPDHPERFDHWQQVLCREGLSGTRCYWEVQWSGKGGFIGVAYKGITRKGEAKDGVFGGNDQSWSLVSSGLSCSFWHSRRGAAITGPLAPRIGVYVDHRAGTLSFYSVSGDTATLLHRVQASFTEPLYPGFGIGLNTTVGLCQLDRPVWS
ncbi:TRI16 protein, partial [Atractosteus spatula]|nr:TRI16 protein [Atractosteus spatula]